MALGAVLLWALWEGFLGGLFNVEGRFWRAAALLMRALHMQKLHIIFLACEAVNGGVNCTSAQSAYVICTVRVGKSFRLLWNRPPVWAPTGTCVVRMPRRPPCCWEVGECEWDTGT